MVWMHGRCEVVGSEARMSRGAVLSAVVSWLVG